MSNKMILVLHSRCCRYAIQYDPETNEAKCGHCKHPIEIKLMAPEEPFSIGALNMVFADEEHMQALPTAPTVQDEPMEFLEWEDEHTICGLLKTLYWAETDEGKKQQLRRAVSFAKKMDRGLRHNKEKRDQEMAELKAQIRAILDKEE